MKIVLLAFYLAAFLYYGHHLFETARGLARSGQSSAAEVEPKSVTSDYNKEQSNEQ